LVKKVSGESRVFTEEDHLTYVDDKIKKLYSELKSYIISLGNDIEVRPKKHYISFRRKHTFISFRFFKSKLKTYLNIEIDQINDPLKKARDVRDLGQFHKTE
jgi:predicted transport protein